MNAAIKTAISAHFAQTGRDPFFNDLARALYGWEWTLPGVDIAPFVLTLADMCKRGDIIITMRRTKPHPDAEWTNAATYAVA